MGTHAEVRLVSVYDDRLTNLINQGARSITSDDVTDNGRITLDATHKANGKQSGIGSWFTSKAREGIIVSTGQLVKSNAPHRKKGAIRLWTVTDKGVAWAATRAAPKSKRPWRLE